MRLVATILDNVILSSHTWKLWFLCLPQFLYLPNFSSSVDVLNSLYMNHYSWRSPNSESSHLLLLVSSNTHHLHRPLASTSPTQQHVLVQSSRWASLLHSSVWPNGGNWAWFVFFYNNRRKKTRWETPWDLALWIHFILKHYFMMLGTFYLPVKSTSIVKTKELFRNEVRL